MILCADGIFVSFVSFSLLSLFLFCVIVDTEDNFYFDLVDLGRRLLLTGGLILVGEKSNTQIFLGALLCFIWLMLVTVRRPYEAYWDNVLSIVLSSQLVLIMLCGMALEMNRLTPTKAADPYEKTSFGVLMVAFSIVIIMSSISAIIITIPCLRDRLVVVYMKRCSKTDDSKEKDEEQQKIEAIEEEKKSSSSSILPSTTAAKKKKKRRLSSRELMKESNSGEMKTEHPELEMTAISISDKMPKKRMVTNPHWKKIRTAVKVSKSFKSEGQKQRTKKLSKVMKARRDSENAETTKS